MVFMGKKIGGLVNYWIDAKNGARPRAHNPLIQQSNNPAFGVVPEVGIAPTSPPLQGGANLSQLLGDTDNGQMDEWIAG